MKLKQGLWQGQDLELKQQQKLIITPQMRQAIEILQMPVQELREKIKEEIESNPVLEIEEDGETFESLDSGEKSDIEPEWEEMFANTDYAFSRQVEGGYRDRTNPLNYTSGCISFVEYLLQQFNLLARSREEKSIGAFLIGCIDERGYLTLDIEEISRCTKTKVDLVKNVLKKIQSLDPPGVGARNLQECLLIQLENLECDEKCRESAKRIIKDFFSELTAGNFKEIIKRSGLDTGAFRQARDLIRKLNPLPADCFFERINPVYLEPDLEVREVNGRFVIINNYKNIPSLYINPYYRKILNDPGAEDSLKEFVKKKINSALWLIKCIEQRQLTIYRIMETIVELQYDFFRFGKKHLRPMTLLDVAEIIGVHESTVSRASSGKYVQTPHGIFEMKDFFQSGVGGTDDAQALSAYSIKQIITQLIEEEDKKRPLSDSKLADIIKQRGCDISRRTVAKYRNQLGIPSSTKRKRI